MTFLYAWETQTLCSANCNPPHFLRCSAWLWTTQCKYILPACQRHKGETLSINSTCSRGAVLFTISFFPGSKFDCMFVLAQTPFLYFSPFHSNIINTFHSCQSKKLKLTYIKAPHPSYISRSRMGRGWRAEINVLECFPVSVCVRVCERPPRVRRGTEDWMCESESAC